MLSPFHRARDACLAMWSEFSLEQRRAIAAFLRFIVEDEGALEAADCARVALDFYWTQVTAPGVYQESEG